jgi:pyruvate dehydrogenase E2 component (dihydrolipoamide acetyltransferase)
MSPDTYTVAAPNRIRRVMAVRMRQSATEIPQVTLQAAADAGPLVSLAADRGPAEPRITVTVHLLHVIAGVLSRHTRVNSCVVEGETRLFDVVNLGVATATRHGLVVPVIRDAAALSVPEIAARLSSLRERAQSGTLQLADMVDATFTVTNLGAYGVQHFNPLINPPQVAILGVGAIAPRLHPLGDGTTVVRQELPLSLTFDHAAIDGAEAATFLRDAVASIERYPAP